MTVKIIDGCIGCGLCAETCPHVFRMTDNDVAEVYATPTSEDENLVLEAKEGCPVSVIEVN